MVLFSWETMRRGGGGVSHGSWAVYSGSRKARSEVEPALDGIFSRGFPVEYVRVF